MTKPASKLAPTWARPSADVPYCAIDEITRSGRVVAYCRGSFPTTETHEIHDAPLAADRCGGCLRALAERAVARHHTEQAIAELKKTAPVTISTAEGSIAFDVRDVVGDGGNS